MLPSYRDHYGNWSQFIIRGRHDPVYGYHSFTSGYQNRIRIWWNIKKHNPAHENTDSESVWFYKHLSRLEAEYNLYNNTYNRGPYTDIVDFQQKMVKNIIEPAYYDYLLTFDEPFLYETP